MLLHVELRESDVSPDKFYFSRQQCFAQNSHIK